jgi:hypothetical protein
MTLAKCGVVGSHMQAMMCSSKNIDCVLPEKRSVNPEENQENVGDIAKQEINLNPSFSIPTGKICRCGL